MSPDRETAPQRLYLLRLRWGLVSLGSLAFLAVRLVGALLDQWVTLRQNADWHLLAPRLSQLKPYPWKVPSSVTTAVLLAIALFACAAALLAIGVREAITAPRAPDEEEPTAPR
jgi:hypothetical protein